MAKDFLVKFWGVRGTIPRCDKKNIKYGGNTSCIEIVCGNKSLIFDAGTGMYELGKNIKEKNIDIFLSHTHLDHIQGLPFFKPLYNKDCTITIWAGHLKTGVQLRNIIERIMSSPIFPLNIRKLNSQVKFKKFVQNRTIKSEELKKLNIKIETKSLNHPDNATAYKVIYRGKSICYVTDVEHFDHIDQTLADFVKDTDILIYDSTFDDKDYQKYKGWGHSTWQEAAKLAQTAKVKKLVAFHHDPAATDYILSKREKKIKKQLHNAVLAKENMVIKLR